jgi:hypothetical protein
LRVEKVLHLTVEISLVALQAGGYSHPWSSEYVLCTLLIGVALLFAFAIWEWKMAPYPMIPHEMFAGQRIVAMAYGIALIAGELKPMSCSCAQKLNIFLGMKFVALLNFFPVMFRTVFDPSPVPVGLKGLTTGIGIISGSVLFNSALSRLKGHNREVLLLATILMSKLA